MNKTKIAYYKLLKKTITNWEQYDLARKDESFTARLEELQAYVEAWDDISRPLLRTKDMSLPQMQMQLGKTMYRTWLESRELMAEMEKKEKGNK